MEKIEKSRVFDLMFEQLCTDADEPESVRLTACQPFMEVVAAAVQRGSAADAIGSYREAGEYGTWVKITEMLEDLDIDTPASAYVRNSVQRALEAFGIKEADHG